MHFGVGRTIIVGALIAYGATVATAAGATGSVGPYRFSTGTSYGQSVTCGFSGASLAKISEQPPMVKMRAYWHQSHDGRVADAQYVGFAAILSGERGGRWTTLATKHHFTLVGMSWKHLPALPAFTPSSGLKGGYDQYRVREKLTWLRPTDNRREGSVTVSMAHYRDASVWRSSCVRAHPAITSRSLPVARIGRFYGSALRAAGVGPFAWSRTAGSLQGLALSTGGRLAGTPANTPGRSTVTIRVRDGNGLTATRTLPLSVAYAAGDVNGDGAVTCADVTIIENDRGGNRTHLQGDLTGDGKVDDADETAFANAYHAAGCPVTGLTLPISSNGSSVVWSVGLDPNGRAVHVHAVNNHGGSWDWDTGAILWRSPTVNDNVGWSTSDTVTVTVTAVGRTTLNGSASATTPAQTYITAWDGGIGTHQPGTCTGACHTLNFQVHNFPVGSYTWQCLDNGSVYYTSSATIHITDPNQSFVGNSQSWCENTNSQTAIRIDGITSSYAML